MSARAHNAGGQGGSRGFGGGPQYSDPPRPRLSFVAEVWPRCDYTAVQLQVSGMCRHELCKIESSSPRPVFRRG